MSNEGKIPAGYYKGRALAGSEQYGSKDGTDQIALDVSVPSLNRTFTTFLYFTDAAAPYAIERLRACGWKGDDITKLVGIDGNEVDVQIKYEVYNGKEQMKVEIATGGGTIKLQSVMDEKQKRQFGARISQLIKTGAPKPPPKAKTPRDNSMPDDDRFGGPDESMPDF